MGKVFWYIDRWDRCGVGFIGYIYLDSVCYYIFSDVYSGLKICCICLWNIISIGMNVYVGV